MESEPLKVLQISRDEAFSRSVAEVMRGLRGAVTVVNFDLAVATLKNEFFHAVLFEPSTTNAAGLFQITSLAVQVPKVPVIVIGSIENETFAVEAITAGAQDFLAKEEFSPRRLERKIRCAIERHHERVALLQEKENYYSVFDHLIEGIFRTAPDGHYLLANIALAKIYGYETPTEMMARITDIGRSLYVDSRRREEFVRLMQENDTLTGFESQIYRKDGSIIWISENCHAIRDESGKVIYYEGTVEDITHRRQMEEALKHSESLYHSLVETMPQGVFRRDLEGRFTFANQPYCKYIKHSLEELLGKTDFDLFPKEAAEKYWRDDLAIMQRGETMEITEESQPIGSSEKVYHHVIKTPLRDDSGKVIGLQGMFWDITEKIRAEEQIRRTTAELGRSREELRIKNSLMQESLHMAREIQLAMLPQTYPSFPKDVVPEQSAFQFVHRYHPAEAVSGDFFNVIALSDTEANILICDVTGHGVRAALVTAMIRALSEELKTLAHEPGMFLRKLNSDLCSILKSTGSPMLTTALHLIANAETGVVRFANAGHPKPLLVRRSENLVQPLVNASGHSQPALGLFDDPPYQATELTLTPGDLLMLFTDGLYEVQGVNEELYSQQRMVLDIKNLIQKPSTQLFDELLECIRNFSVNREFEDDVCIVGMDFAKYLKR
ncbi:MAG TPA: SpoIIE family protein phosphatase [Verrucomicrobiae bacterium]|nr:SpoIIE family protein phosphatase [Verrucomicrobiae bacterium]